MGKLYVIGIDERGLDKRLEDILLSCCLVAGGRRMLKRFESLLDGKPTFAIGSNLKQVQECIRKELFRGDVAVLATGDPLFFGIGRYLLDNFDADIQIIPGVSVMQQAFARLGRTWEHARFVSLHGRHFHGELLKQLLSDIRRFRSVFFFTDKVNSPDMIAAYLIEHGCPNIDAAVLEELGTENERILRGDLAKIAAARYSANNVMILENPEPAEVPEVVLGRADGQYEHSGGMITKAEVRAIVISKLGLCRDSIVWDIGAGSGSVSIEAASLAHLGRVYAVERGSVEFIRQNAKKFSALNLEIVQGEAPECLDSIGDDPDAVFIGGSGGNIGGILSEVSERLRPGGRILLAVVSQENLCKAQEVMKNLGMEFELTLVNIARTKKSGSTSFFSPLTPVFLVNGWWGDNGDR